MVLKGKGCFFGMRTVRRAFEPASGAGQLDIVLDQHAVVQNGDARGREEFAGVVKSRSGVNDVIDLPLAGGKGGVHEWRILSIDGGGLAVHIGLAFKRVEDLDFITAKAKEDAAVSTALS